jgi:hypothetical protein
MREHSGAWLWFLLGGTLVALALLFLPSCV